MSPAKHEVGRHTRKPETADKVENPTQPTRLPLQRSQRGQDQIAPGKTYPTAVRALAFNPECFRGMFVCWRDRVPYDEKTYLHSLKRRGSHLPYKLNQQLPKAA